jgi:hypothetical protein
MTGTDSRPLVTTGDCYSASYANALAGLGLDWVVLGDRWGYTWRPDPGEPLGDIRITPLDFGSALVDWFALEIRELRFADTAAFLAWLAADPSRMVIVGVDSFWLPHSANHQVSHFPHAVAVNESGPGHVWMADGYRGSSFAGQVAAAELVPALAGMRQFTHRHRTLQRERIELGPPELLALEIVVPDTRAAAARLTATAMLDRLRFSCRTHLRPAVTQLGQEYANGRAALYAAADALEAMAQASLRDDQIRYVMSCFASIASQRALNAAYVHRAAARAGRPAVAAYADQLRRAGQRWITLRNTVYLRMSKGEDVRDRCAARMRELAAADHELTVGLRAEIDCA